MLPNLSAQWKKGRKRKKKECRAPDLSSKKKEKRKKKEKGRPVRLVLDTQRGGGKREKSLCLTVSGKYFPNIKKEKKERARKSPCSPSAKACVKEGKKKKREGRSSAKKKKAHHHFQFIIEGKGKTQKSSASVRGRWKEKKKKEKTEYPSRPWGKKGEKGRRSLTSWKKRRGLAIFLSVVGLASHSSIEPEEKKKKTERSWKKGYTSPRKMRITPPL